MHLLSICTMIEYALLGLIFFYEYTSVGFFSDSVLYHICPERIWSWLWMGHLHPVWTESVNFRCIAELLFFNWSASRSVVRINCYPFLMFWNYLHHWRWLSAAGCISVHNIPVIGIVHYPEVGWYVLLVPNVLLPGLFISLRRSWLASFNLIQISKDPTIRKVLLLVLRNLKLPLEYHLSLCCKWVIPSFKFLFERFITCRCISFFLKIYFTFVTLPSVNLSPLTYVKSEFVVSVSWSFGCFKSLFNVCIAFEALMKRLRKLSFCKL